MTSRSSKPLRTYAHLPAHLADALRCYALEHDMSPTKAVNALLVAQLNEADGFRRIEALLLQHSETLQKGQENFITVLADNIDLLADLQHEAAKR